MTTTIGTPRGHSDDAATWPLSRAVSRVAEIAAAAQTSDELIASLARLFTEAVTDASTSVITLAEAGRITGATPANEQGAWVADYQMSADSSVAHSVLAGGKPVYVEDWTRETGWGPLQDAVVDHGIRSSSCRPLIVNGQIIGTLCLLSERVGQFQGETNDRIDEFGALAAAAIVASRRQFDDTTEAANLRQALVSRATIDHALGIIIAIERCSPDEAFNILTKASQSRNIRLRDIAADLVATYSRPAAK